MDSGTRPRTRGVISRVGIAAERVRHSYADMPLSRISLHAAGKLDRARSRELSSDIALCPCRHPAILLLLPME